MTERELHYCTTCRRWLKNMDEEANHARKGHKALGGTSRLVNAIAKSYATEGAS